MVYCECFENLNRPVIRFSCFSIIRCMKLSATLISGVCYIEKNFENPGQIDRFSCYFIRMLYKILRRVWSWFAISKKNLKIREKLSVLAATLFVRCTKFSGGSEWGLPYQRIFENPGWIERFSCYCIIPCTKFCYDSDQWGLLYRIITKLASPQFTYLRQN